MPLTAAQRFSALLTGDIDVLIRNTTWTQGRDAAVDFGPTTFYDGQKLMGKTPVFGADSVLADIDGTKVCVVIGSTGADNIANAAAAASLTPTFVPVANEAEATAQLLAGTCDLYTTDESSLVSARFNALGSGGENLVIFPGTPISKEPLGPVYRGGDSTWADIIDWVVYAMIIADEKGITSANIGETWDNDVQSTALFGGAGERQTAMHLDADAFREVITQVGNYNEVFEANLTPVGFARAGTLNARYGVDGGLLFAPPAGGSVPAGLAPAAAPTVSTLAAVKARGELRCGVNGGLAGFSIVNGAGASGFDVALCRAVATAVLGDATLVDYVPLTSAERFNALAHGDIDVLIRNTTRTQGRESAFDFAPTTFYDGQKLLGRASAYSAPSTFADIGNATVCVVNGSTGADNVVNVAAAAGVTITVVKVASETEAGTKLLDASCDLFTTDESGLMSLRASLAAGGGPELVIFPYIAFSKEPLGPVYRANDSAWGDVINWTVYAMFMADKKGITAGNIGDSWDTDAESTALFGGTNERQTAMGLAADAFRKVIAAVGNYGEVFEANLKPLGFSRTSSANARYGAEGGLIFSPPAGGSVPQ